MNSPSSFSARKTKSIEDSRGAKSRYVAKVLLVYAQEQLQQTLKTHEKIPSNPDKKTGPFLMFGPCWLAEGPRGGRGHALWLAARSGRFSVR